MPVDQRPPVLREFARRIRGGRAFLTVAANATDDAFSNASIEHSVFQVRSDPTAYPPT